MIVTENTPWRQLLLLRVLLIANDNSRAKELGTKIVEPLVEVRMGSYFGSLLSHYHGPVSLQPQYAQAVQWLREQFPGKVRAIDERLGTRVRTPSRCRAIPYDYLPSSKLIPDLLARLENASNIMEAKTIRQKLRMAYEEEGRYIEAARVIAPDAVGPLSGYGVHGLIQADAIAWSMLKRRADAESLHQKNPLLLASARAILANIPAARFNHPRIEGRAWLTEQEVEKRIVTIGPCVLSSVFDELQPNRTGGGNGGYLVRVIAQIGEVQDIPVVINALTNYGLEEASNSCIEKLTGEKCTENTRDARIEFWTKWWQTNAERIVRSKRR